MRVTTKGQITIPREIREQLGILPGTDVDVVVDGEDLRIRRVQANESDISSWIRNVRGIAGEGMTTDEIMAITRGED